MRGNTRSSAPRSFRITAGALLCAALLACGGGGGGTADSDIDVALTEAFIGLVLDRPVKLVQHPTDDDRWYVVEQGGLIWTFEASDPANTQEIALDLPGDVGVNLGGGNEQGLLSMAFDPDFAISDELYLTFTDEDFQDVVLVRALSPDDGLTFVIDADPIVLAIPHAANNHNGGDIAFGPDDFLYYSMGDGEDHASAQNRSALLGKVLRIDVRGTPPAGEDYAVPNTNPFYMVGRPFCDSGVSPAVPAQPCPEVWASGLRNPWRMNFDPATGNLWLGDVGESQREEIDRIVSGGNYGWSCLEAELTGPGAGLGCTGPFVAPEVAHIRDDARSITGGVVYRGTSIPDLFGHYVYADFLTGRFFAFDADDANAPVERLGVDQTNVSAFGQGRDGEAYVVSFDTIYKLVPPAP